MAFVIELHKPYTLDVGKEVLGDALGNVAKWTALSMVKEGGVPCSHSRAGFGAGRHSVWRGCRGKHGMVCDAGHSPSGFDSHTMMA